MKELEQIEMKAKEIIEELFDTTVTKGNMAVREENDTMTRRS